MSIKGTGGSPFEISSTGEEVAKLGTQPDIEKMTVSNGVHPSENCIKTATTTDEVAPPVIQKSGEEFSPLEQFQVRQEISPTEISNPELAKKLEEFVPPKLLGTEPKEIKEGEGPKIQEKTAPPPKKIDPSTLHSDMKILENSLAEAAGLGLATKIFKNVDETLNPYIESFNKLEPNNKLPLANFKDKLRNESDLVSKKYNEDRKKLPEMVQKKQSMMSQSLTDPVALQKLKENPAYKNLESTMTSSLTVKFKKDNEEIIKNLNTEVKKTIQELTTRCSNSETLKDDFIQEQTRTENYQKIEQFFQRDAKKIENDPERKKTNELNSKKEITNISNKEGIIKYAKYFAPAVKLMHKRGVDGKIVPGQHKVGEEAWKILYDNYDGKLLSKLMKTSDGGYKTEMFDLMASLQSISKKTNFNEVKEGYTKIIEKYFGESTEEVNITKEQRVLLKSKIGEALKNWENKTDFSKSQSGVHELNTYLLGVIGPQSFLIEPSDFSTLKQTEEWKKDEPK